MNSLGVNAVQSVVNDFQLCTAKFMTAGGQNGGPGWRWANGAMGYSMFNTVAPPNYNLWGGCRMDCCVQAEHDHYVNAMSNHPGGVNVVMADGSARFIKNSISMATWWALGTKNNGEVITSDSYSSAESTPTRGAVASLAAAPCRVSTTWINNDRYGRCSSFEMR